MSTSNQKSTVVGSLVWKFLERGGVQVIQFIVSILIARILTPHDYGSVALLTIFISIATVFVQSGLSTALVQKKDADELDCSSVFYYSVALALIVYLILFFSAELIADFYNMPELVSILRVMSITLFPGALNALQIAILSKNMQFKKQFYSSLSAAIFSGIVGLSMAVLDYGPWALVFQQLSYQSVICIVLFFLVKWRPQFNFSFTRTKSLLSYGLRLLAARLIDTVYHNLESLIIGKKYSADTLAYCNKGKQFPMTLIDNIDGSVQSVMLPAYSAKQDDLGAVKAMLRKTVSMSTFFVFPAMITLAAMGEPLIGLVLGDKWLDSVPYLQLFCAVSMLFPLQTANLQAINAIGRSDTYLKLMTIKRVLGVVILFASICVYDSPFSLVIAALIIEVVAVLVNVPSNKMLLDYHLYEQIQDVLPNLVLALVVGVVVYLINYISLSYLLTLFLQMLTALISFCGLVFITKNNNLKYVINVIRKR
ncbi:lipopolysaccharide biosynthesis protein [Bacteroides congonensis]|uniref:lipopolysaccharide biosynthesis protein n=1 Tax=Bacteroides congonensis TaxID=1871006 RepID=UPI003A8B0CBD